MFDISEDRWTAKCSFQNFGIGVEKNCFSSPQLSGTSGVRWQLLCGEAKPLHGERKDRCGRCEGGEGTGHTQLREPTSHLPPSPVPSNGHRAPALELHRNQCIVFLDTNPFCSSLLPYLQLAKCDLRQWVSVWVTTAYIRLSVPTVQQWNK